MNKDLFMEKIISLFLKEKDDTAKFGGFTSCFK